MNQQINTTSHEIIGTAIRQAFNGEPVADPGAIVTALREVMATGDLHSLGCQAAKALLDYAKSDVQAQREVLRAQINAKGPQA